MLKGIISMYNEYDGAHSPCDLSLLHPIHHAIGLAVAEEFTLGTAEEVTYLDIGALVFGISPLECSLQSGRDVLQRHPLTTLWICLRGACRLLEERQQLFTELTQLLIAQVMLHQGMLFLTGEMVALPLARHLILQLGIELRIVDGRLWWCR